MEVIGIEALYNHIHILRTVCNQTLYFCDSFQSRGFDTTYLQY